MKRSVLFLLLAMLVWACSPSKQVSKTAVTLSPGNQDSTEYEIVIIDPEFDHWYLVNYSPAKDYTLEYYHGRNQVAAANWNYYYQAGKYRNIIDSNVDYQPNIDYGIEVNRKLYWYFKYIEENFNISLF